MGPTTPSRLLRQGAGGAGGGMSVCSCRPPGTQSRAEERVTMGEGHPNMHGAGADDSDTQAWPPSSGSRPQDILVGHPRDLGPCHMGAHADVHQHSRWGTHQQAPKMTDTHKRRRKWLHVAPDHPNEHTGEPHWHTHGHGHHGDSQGPQRPSSTNRL